MIRCLNLREDTYLLLHFLSSFKLYPVPEPPHIVIAGNGKLAVFSMVVLVPRGFWVNLLRHLILCQITKTKQAKEIKTENNEKMVFLWAFCLFMLEHDHKLMPRQ